MSAEGFCTQLTRWVTIMLWILRKGNHNDFMWRFKAATVNWHAAPNVFLSHKARHSQSSTHATILLKMYHNKFIICWLHFVNISSFCLIVYQQLLLRPLAVSMQCNLFCLKHQLIIDTKCVIILYMILSFICIFG